MNTLLHAHLPWTMVDEGLEIFIERRIGPEFFLPAEVLEKVVPEKLEAAAAALAQAELPCTIHAPFMDLNPGSFEPLLREATVRRFAQIMEVAKVLRPRVMVFHPGYDRWRYGEQKERWLELSLPVWAPVVEQAEEIGCIIGVENIFEEEPSTLRQLLDRVGSPCFRHCFDVGHWNLFSRVSMEEWFQVMGESIAITHVHDNRGKADDHAAPGEGEIDFPLFFRLMESHAPQAVRTLEAHSRGCLERALAYFRDRSGR